VADADLDSWAPDSNHGRNGTVTLRTMGNKSVVLRFDLASMPPGAVVQKATLRVRTTGEQQLTLRTDVVGLRTDWTETGVTWNLAAPGKPWAGPGAGDANLDRLEQSAATALVSGGDRWWEWEVTALAQEWVSGRLANNGLILVCNESSVHAEVSIATKEYGQPAQLLLRYVVPAPTWTPAPTETPAIVVTPSATPQTQRVTLQAIADAALDGLSPDGQYGSKGTAVLRTAGAGSPILMFSLADLPEGAIVREATLRVHTIGGNGPDVWVDVVRLRRAWVESEVTWNVAAAGQPWALPGAKDVGLDRFAIAESGSMVAPEHRWWEWDVTALVQDWATGLSPNYGVILTCDTTTESGTIDVATRESDQPPQLVVVYSGPSALVRLHSSRSIRMERIADVP